MDETKRAAAVRTTKIAVEMDTLTIDRRAEAALAWCPGCRAEVDVITLGNLPEAVTTTQIQDWFGTTKLHFWQLGEGAAQICVRSLLRYFAPQTSRISTIE